MFDILPLALPAVLVTVVAAVLVRREQEGRAPSPDPDFDVRIVPVGGSDWKPTRVPTTLDRHGALVTPDDCTLGGRMRSMTTPSTPRVRRRQLVAVRASS